MNNSRNNTNSKGSCNNNNNDYGCLEELQNTHQFVDMIRLLRKRDSIEQKYKCKSLLKMWMIDSFTRSLVTKVLIIWSIYKQNAQLKMRVFKSIPVLSGCTH